MLKENKWLNGAIPALLIHICIGSVYCWSLLKNKIAEEMLISSDSIELSFSLAIFFLGMSAAFSGRFVEKNVHYSSLLSTIFFSTGLLLTTVAMYIKSIWLIYLSYGCIMGIGLGIGYLSPIKTLMLWFKDNKGLATGIAISGFGLSKALLSPFIEWCDEQYSIYVTLFSISIVSMVLMTIASFLIKKPSYWKENTEKISIKDSLSILKNKDYIKIWLIFYLNITCGLALISFEKNLCLENGIVIVALVSSLTAFFNTIGRFGYSTYSDYLNKKSTIYSIIFISCIVAILIYQLNIFNIIFATVLLLCVVNCGYGGGFSTLPILLQSKFGMNNISAIHGLTLSAWAFAGLSGNQISNLVINKLNLGYSILITILGILFTISLLLSLNIRKHE